MSLANIPVCAESAYYATHPNNHIPYVIARYVRHVASALRNVIIGNGMLWLAMDERDSSTPSEDC